MSKLADYQNKYECMHFERRDGVLLVTFHTKGGPLRWGIGPHEECPRAFYDMAGDRDTKVMIFTGTGDEYSGPEITGHATSVFPTRPELDFVDRIIWEGKHLMMNLLNIEVPIISAVNGPAVRHAEIPLLADIVLATDDTYFMDSGHFKTGMVPGDGVHVVYPMLMGVNRARHFLLTGRRLYAKEAHELGIVAEVLPRDKLMDRAWEYAKDIAAKPPMLGRFTRVVLTEYMKRQMQDLVSLGLYVEGLGLMEKPEAR
jgi:enoyl-CoA hydratase/carnithine racemase